MQLDFGLLSMTELRTRPGELLNRVAGGEAFIIERNGRREACLVPLSHFFPDIPPTRIAAEIQTLEDHGECLRTSITDERELVFRIPHQLADGSLTEVSILLPHGYPNICPRVYANDLRNTAPHRWADGALCLYGAVSGWNPGKHTVYSTLQLAREWLRHYDEWIRHGQWPQAEDASK
jgi:prevent-host-death family protein